MKRIKWLIVGLLLTVVIGFVLCKLWNLVVGVFAAGALLVLLVAAIFAGPGFGWDDDDDDEEEDDDD